MFAPLDILGGLTGERTPHVAGPLIRIRYEVGGKFTEAVGGSSGAGDQPLPVLALAPVGLPFMRYMPNLGVLGGIDPGGGGGGGPPGSSSGAGELAPPVLALAPVGLPFAAYRYAEGTIGNRAPLWEISLGDFEFDEGVARTIDLIAEGYVADADGDSIVIGAIPDLPLGFQIAQSPPRIIYDGSLPAGDYGEVFIWADDGRSLASIVVSGGGVSGTLVGATLLQGSMSLTGDVLAVLSGGAVALAGTIDGAGELQGTLTSGSGGGGVQPPAPTPAPSPAPSGPFYPNLSRGNGSPVPVTDGPLTVKPRFEVQQPTRKRAARKVLGNIRRPGSGGDVI